MKNKLRNKFKILNYIIESDKYKITFIITLALAIYGSVVLGFGQPNFIDANFVVFMFPIFNIFMFTIIFLNTLSVCGVFNNELPFYVLRLENKKKYLKEYLKNVLVFNFFNFLIFFLLYFMIMILLKYGMFEIHLYEDYSVSNLVYLLFYLGRYLIFSLIISLISSLIFINFKSKVTMLFNSIFMTGFLLGFAGNINKIFYFLPWSYFNYSIYDTFSLEICLSIGFGLVLEIIVYLLYKYTLKNKRMEIT